MKKYWRVDKNHYIVSGTVSAIMSKVNQIQNALYQLDGGIFQKLADAYLCRKGYTPHFALTLQSIIIFAVLPE
jgi:hypothetical protein